MNECANSMATDNYMATLEEQERELENLESDIEPHKQEVEELVARMKEIAKQYENIDGEEEIRNFVMDLL